MQQLQAIRGLLMQFPLWGDQPLTVDTATNKPEGSTLYPLGLQVLSRREDVQGNAVLRIKQSFLLRRVSVPGESAADWLLSLQHWLPWQPVGDMEPFFGAKLRLWAEGGRLVSGKQPGTGIYEVKIHAQYEKE